MFTKTIKVIQVNVYKGRYFKELVNFLKGEDADFITAQEVTEGNMSLSQVAGGSIFNSLCSELGMQGKCHFDLFLRGGGKAGNAVFSKHKILDSKVLQLKAQHTYGNSEFAEMTRFEDVPRHLLDTRILLDGLTIHVASWHGAWTAPPEDTLETLRQSAKAAEYIKQIKEPFIIGCDLNAIVGSKTIELISRLANNLMISSGVPQTTHPTVHKIAPRGYMVDYIFASRDFKVESLRVPQITVSDHLPVVAQLSFEP